MNLVCFAYCSIRFLIGSSQNVAMTTWMRTCRTLTTPMLLLNLRFPPYHHARQPVRVHLRIRVTPFLRTLRRPGTCPRRWNWPVDRAWTKLLQMQMLLCLRKVCLLRANGLAAPADAQGSNERREKLLDQQLKISLCWPLARHLCAMQQISCPQWGT